jgi:hypothetical protein
MYFLERVYATVFADIRSQDFIERVLDLSVTTGQAPKSITQEPEVKKNLTVYKTPVEKPKTSPVLPTTPPKPHIFTDIASQDNLTSGSIEDRKRKN